MNGYCKQLDGQVCDVKIWHWVNGESMQGQLDIAEGLKTEKHQVIQLCIKKYRKPYVGVYRRKSSQQQDVIKM